MVTKTKGGREGRRAAGALDCLPKIEGKTLTAETAQTSHTGLGGTGMEMA